MQKIELQELEARSSKSWNVDGLPEMVMGLLLVLWGVVLLLPDLFPKGSWTNVYWNFSTFFLMFSGFAANWLTKRLKERWTIRRIGYVELKKPKTEHQLAAAILAFVVAGAIGIWIALTKLANRQDLSAPAVGVLFAAALLVAAWRFQLPNYRRLALVAVVAGACLYPFGLGMAGIAWLLLILGLAMAAMGGWRLRDFLKANPVEVEQ